MAQRKYKVKHNFFDTLSLDSAYVLGFLAADGNVSKDKRIILGVCQRDVSLLNNISILMGSTYPIKTYIAKNNSKEYPQKILRFSSPYMCEILSQYGIYPRKSLSLKFPDIEQKFIPSFVRGYFDGDGSITITKKRNIFVTILGTEDFVRTLKHHFNDACNTRSGWVARHNHSKVFHFCVHGNVCGKSFLDWIYAGSSPTTRLDRKYMKYRSVQIPSTSPSSSGVTSSASATNLS